MKPSTTTRKNLLQSPSRYEPGLYATRGGSLVLLIILISTGQLTELVVLFMPVIVMGLLWTVAYRQARRRTHKWWRHDKRDN